MRTAEATTQSARSKENGNEIAKLLKPSIGGSGFNW
jgi:hypothetical protein